MQVDRSILEQIELVTDIVWWHMSEYAHDMTGLARWITTPTYPAK